MTIQHDLSPAQNISDVLRLLADAKRGDSVKWFYWYGKYAGMVNGVHWIVWENEYETFDEVCNLIDERNRENG